MGSSGTERRRAKAAVAEAALVDAALAEVVAKIDLEVDLAPTSLFMAWWRVNSGSRVSRGGAGPRAEDTRCRRSA